MIRQRSGDSETNEEFDGLLDWTRISRTESIFESEIQEKRSEL